jgi:hypothetical protein
MAIHKGLTKGLPLAERLAIASETDPVSGCRVWRGAKTTAGYGTMRWDGKRNQHPHRFAYEIAFGPIPAGIFCLHRCDNRACINPDHLFLGTKGDNNRDRAEKGRNAVVVGTQRYNAKLTDDLVRLIRASPLRNGEIARLAGVDPSIISEIRAFRRWKHVK